MKGKVIKCLIVDAEFFCHKDTMAQSITKLFITHENVIRNF
jgi:hypothetical protein